MKKLLVLGCTVFFAIGCNNNATAPEAKTDSTKMAETKTEKLDYPYTIDHPGEYWVPGDPKHALNVLKSLKAFENGNTAEAASYFGDSVRLTFDRYRAKVSNDSLKKLFAQWRADSKEYVIKMDDWESQKSNDGKQEWVTLWYKQIMTDKAGKTDSIDVVDDLKIENGKIVLLDEKTQHYPEAKKK